MELVKENSDIHNSRLWRLSGQRRVWVVAQIFSVRAIFCGPNEREKRFYSIWANCIPALGRSGVGDSLCHLGRFAMRLPRRDKNDGRGARDRGGSEKPTTLSSKIEST